MSSGPTAVGVSEVQKDVSEEEEIVGIPIKVYEYYDEVKNDLNEKEALKVIYESRQSSGDFSELIVNGSMEIFKNESITIVKASSDEAVIQEAFDVKLGDECESVGDQVKEEKEDEKEKKGDDDTSSSSSSEDEDEKTLPAQAAKPVQNSKPLITIGNWTQRKESDEKPVDGLVKRLLETWHSIEETKGIEETHWKQVKHKIHIKNMTSLSTSMDVVIIEPQKKKTESKRKSSGRFQIQTPSGKREFQIRRQSVIKPIYETIITDLWIENAVRHYEKVKPGDQFEIISSEFEGDHPEYQAKIVANVNNVTKSYDWVIRARIDQEKSDLLDYEPSSDSSASIDIHFKSTNIESSIGDQIQKFVDRNLKDRKKNLRLGFLDVIFSDSEYAIFDDLSSYYQITEPFFDFLHFKHTIRTLACLHASSHAYFLNSHEDDLSTLSENLKLIIDTPYQIATPESLRMTTTDKLKRAFDAALKVIGDKDLEEEANSRVEKEHIYSIFKEARRSSSWFSVLCHGRPTVDVVYFQKEADEKTSLNNNEDVISVKDIKFDDFEDARYANAVTDLQILFNTSLDPSYESQSEFLLRYEYFETLLGTLKLLNCSSSNLDFDTFMEEFKAQKFYGYIYSAMIMTNQNNPNSNRFHHSEAIDRSKNLIKKFIEDLKLGELPH